MEKRSVQKRSKTTEASTAKSLIDRYRRQFDPNYKGSQGEINKEPSLTTPDMSLTVLELLTNHARGMGSNINQNQGQYFDTEIPVFDDITDEIAYKEELKQRLKDVENAAKAQKEQKEAEILEAQKEAAKAAEIEKQSPDPGEKL